MPTSICPSCQRRRPVADYIAKLPLLCTGCGHALTIAADDEPEAIPLVAAASSDSEAKPSHAYIGLSDADIPHLAEQSNVESDVSHPTEFTPSSSDFAISITPDRELSPLVVSEKLSVSSFQLPPLNPALSADDSEKSKLVGRLKEITSMSSARAIEEPPIPLPTFAPLPPPKPVSPLRKFWKRMTRR